MAPGPIDGPDRRVLLALVLVAQFAAPLGLFGLGALAPLVRTALQLSREQVGYVSAVCAWGAVWSCLPTGWLADRLGVHGLLLAVQGVSGLALGALLRWPTYGMLLLAMLLVGVAHGATMVLTTKALADWFPRERRATVMGAKFVAQSGAASVAGLALPPLALGCGWPQAFAAVGGLLVASAVGVLLRYRDPRQAGPPTVLQLAAARRRLWQNRAFWRLGTAGFLFGGWLFAFTAYLTLYLHEHLGYSPVLAGSLLALAHGAATASRVPYGWVSDRWLGGERRALLRGMAGVALGALLALVLLPPGPPPLVLAGTVLLYGASGLAWGSLYQTLATELAGRDAQGLGAGLATALGQLGSTVTSPLFGALADATGSYTASWGLLMLWLLGAMGLLRPDRRAPTP